MKNILKNLALLLASCIFSLLLVELFLRVLDPFQFRVRGDKITLKANFQDSYTIPGSTKLDSLIVFAKNDLGFRGPDKPAQLENYLSIMAVGGSTTECHYSTDGKDWPALLGKKLEPCFDHLWVNNAGLDGHSTFGHQVLLNDYLVQIKPKVILFYTGINDLGRKDLNSFDKSAINGNTQNLREFLLENFVTLNTAYNLLRSWRAKKLQLTHDITFDLTKIPVLEQTPGRRDTMLKECEEQWIPGYRLRLQNLIDTCRRHGIDPVFVTQPVLYGEGIDSLTGANLETIMVWPEADGKTVWEMLKRLNQAMMEVAAQNGCLVIDVASKFPKKSSLYYDLIHYTNEGTDQLSTVICRELQPWLAGKYPAFKKKKINEGCAFGNG